MIRFPSSWTYLRQFSAKGLRWAVRLSDYRYTCYHIEGDDNEWVDLLTRWSPTDPAVQYPVHHLELPSFCPKILVGIYGQNRDCIGAARLNQPRKTFFEGRPLDVFGSHYLGTRWRCWPTVRCFHHCSHRTHWPPRPQCYRANPSVRIQVFYLSERRLCICTCLHSLSIHSQRSEDTTPIRPSCSRHKLQRPCTVWLHYTKRQPERWKVCFDAPW